MRLKRYLGPRTYYSFCFVSKLFHTRSRCCQIFLGKRHYLNLWEIKFASRRVVVNAGNLVVELMHRCVALELFIPCLFYFRRILLEAFLVRHFLFQPLCVLAIRFLFHSYYNLFAVFVAFVKSDPF